MPEEVKDLLSIFEVININICSPEIGLPLQCLGLGTYVQKLTTTMLIPLVIAGFLALRFISSPRGAGGRWAGLLAALPWLLTLSFLTFPMVSSAAFNAFSCETFDNGRSYLRTDYAVDCDSDEYSLAFRLAWTAIFL